MSVAMAKAGINKADALPWIDLPPGMGGATPLSASKHSYFGTVVLQPGDAFPFHRHPNQAETIYIVKGTVEAWYEKERVDMKAGDTMFAPANTVHAFYNTSDKSMLMLVMLSPLVRTTDEDWELADGWGWEMVDVSEEAPWNDLR